MKVIFINNETKFLESFDELFTSSDMDKIIHLELDNMNLLSIPEEIYNLSNNFNKKNLLIIKLRTI